jgi:hypothetical protein
MIRYRTDRVGDVLKLSVGGVLDLEGARRLVSDVAGHVGTGGGCLLVDLRAARGRLSFRDIHTLASTLGEHPEAYSGRIALLDEYDERLEQTQFFEFSTTEQGYQVRTFLDEEEAMVWLDEAAD